MPKPTSTRLDLAIARDAQRSRWVLALAVFLILSGTGADLQTSPIELRVGLTKPGGGYTVVTMSLDTYVARVLAGEAARDSPPAALEALAITIRTFALANRDRHRADGFDLCDDTHCQVVRTSTPATERAAQATAGQVLIRNGVVASVFYSASCGGRTEIPSDVWPGADDPPYLPSVPDEACQGTPAWEAAIGRADLERALRASGFRGARLGDLRVVSRNTSGRIAQLRVDGLTPNLISGQDLRVAVGRTLGWQLVKSTAFELTRQQETFRFSGHGYGHGVGLCVIGSVNLAAGGASASAILAKYFPGLSIAPAGPRISPESPRIQPAPPLPPAPLPATPIPIPPPPAVVSREPVDVFVSLPVGEEGERKVLMTMAARARDDVARALGVAPPARISLRFHATTDDYVRTTGQPWFTSGAIVNTELHLPPLAVLRERGVLDRAVRHELVHMLADAALNNRPAWVREGAAVYYAGEPPIPGESAAPHLVPEPTPTPKTPCPRDSELLTPVSVGALTDARARARACFARQIESGKSWRDVK